MLVISFSEPVLHAPLGDGVTLRDSVGMIVPSELRWLNATDLRIAANAPLHGKAWYQVRVVLDSVQDYAGNRWMDSTWAVAFQTIDLRTTGTIEGVVVDHLTGPGHGRIFVTAASTDLTPARAKTIQLEEPGSFIMEQLPEGKYALSAFRDPDSSGSYSYGNPFPFISSERFTIASDTVKVRARWGVEGVLLKFK
jgi:hypothetical protein